VRKLNGEAEKKPKMGPNVAKTVSCFGFTMEGHQGGAKGKKEGGSVRAIPTSGRMSEKRVNVLVLYGTKKRNVGGPRLRRVP